MQSIVTLTLNPSLDISSSVDAVVPEHKLRCKEPLYEPGGGGLNVSRAIFKLGGQSLACYLAGGHTGTMLQGLLDSEALSHQPIAIAGRTRESFSIYEESSTQQYRFNMPGPTISEVECQQMLDTLASISPAPAYWVVSGSLPPGVPPTIFHPLGDLAARNGAIARGYIGSGTPGRVGTRRLFGQTQYPRIRAAGQPPH